MHDWSSNVGDILNNAQIDERCDDYLRPDGISTLRMEFEHIHAQKLRHDPNIPLGEILLYWGLTTEHDIKVADGGSLYLYFEGVVNITPTTSYNYHITGSNYCVEGVPFVEMRRVVRI